MIRIFLSILFLIIAYKAIASLQGEALICDEDRRGYNFTSKDEVKVISNEVGYKDTAYFCRRFKLMFGVQAGKMRKRLGEI